MRAALVLLLALAGCAGGTGVVLSPADEIACKRESCTAWTEAELKALIRLSIQRGYEAGRKDAKGGV